MSTGQIVGWVGAIVGSVVGLAGGMVGTYFSIKKTNGPRERTFMIRWAIACWIAILLFVALLFALPSPYRLLLWIPYTVLLPLGTVYGNRRQESIRQQELQNKAT